MYARRIGFILLVAVIVAGLQGCVPDPSARVTLGGDEVRVGMADETLELARELTP